MRNRAAYSKLTIRDVAAEAGVSIATVSRVLNGRAPIAPETAAKVRAAVERLGFRANRTGRELRAGISRTVGVLVPSLDNPVFAESVTGIQEAARDAGWSVLIASSGYDVERENEAIGNLLSHRVGGLLLTVADADRSATLDTLDREQTPYVLLYNQPDRDDRATATIDNVAAGRDATRALIAAGHRRLAMVAGRFVASDRSKQRHRGFSEALAEARLEQVALIELDFDAVAAFDPMIRAVLTGPNRPTGLFCSTDLLALRIMALLREAHVAVPGEVGIVGFDGIAVGRLMAPSLATIVQPSREMGRRAFQHLLARLEGAAPEQILLPYEFRPGGSLGGTANAPQGE
ncbi:LacI family transcriptional regulator [Aliidongia dinghuensis]|uniref:LacI family transcriptional regulator n=1 Tax=Aliidongia dinghuensis TaxID=1867774 RepID=A0A8J2YTP5_9PROT|nr:LacI family DNA-binding transcriptional regulator [Aliidongia dinghuensis]GGF19079.1 LacI family transcriptional regulator [Aliidongia dinghuensis]